MSRQDKAWLSIAYRIRYIFSADGKHLLGGMMVGDTSDYVKLVSLVKKKVHFSENIASLIFY